MHTIAIVGTAGRGDDENKLSPAVYTAMREIVKQVIAPYKAVRLVSGGAAVADHLAVQLFLTNPDMELRLHLPAPFDATVQQFVASTSIFNPGNTSNFYHRKFAKSCGVNSLGEIAEAILKRNAEVIVTPGFKQRNTKVAKDADVLIALTFGSGPTVKDGGTADTVRKFQLGRRGQTYHIDCHTMQVYTPAFVSEA